MNKRGLQESEDDEIALAIELSLKETKKTQKTTPAEADEEREYDEQLKRAIEESLKPDTENHTPTTSSSTHPPASASTHPSAPVTTTNCFKLNYIEGLPQKANNNCVKLATLLEQGLQSAFITAYSIDIDWLLAIFPKNVPLTLVKHYDNKVDKPGHFVLSSNLTVLHPPLPPFSNMHAKLMLLLYPKYLRVVISSCNLTKEDWSQIGQVVWHQDFPKIQSGTPPDSVDSPFGRDLRAFVQCLHANPNFLKLYDFRGANVKLVSSVPGYHANEDMTKYGHMLLRETIRTHNGDNKPSSGESHNVYYQTSSLGGTEESWVVEFLASSQGQQLVPKKTTKATKSKGKETKGNPQTPQASPHVALHILFPGHKDMVGSSGRPKIGANMVCLNPKHWNNPEFPKHLMYKTEWSDAMKSKENIVMHSKVILCTGGEPQTASYLYMGSHNFTKAAWGKLQKGDTQLHINNYELGVLSFSPNGICNLCNPRRGCT